MFFHMSASDSSNSTSSPTPMTFGVMKDGTSRAFAWANCQMKSTASWLHLPPVSRTTTTRRHRPSRSCGTRLSSSRIRKGNPNVYVSQESVELDSELEQKVYAPSWHDFLPFSCPETRSCCNSATCAFKHRPLPLVLEVTISTRGRPWRRIGNTVDCFVSQPLQTLQCLLQKMLFACEIGLKKSSRSWRSTSFQNRI